MEIDLRNLLLADAALVALLGAFDGVASIDWVIRPDFSTLPALTLEKISEPIEYNQAGSSPENMARVQIDIWAETYLQTLNISNRLTAYLNSYSGTFGSTRFQRIFEDSTRDLGVDDTDDGERVFHRVNDYIIHFR